MNEIKLPNERPVNYPYISKPFLLMFCGYVIIWYLQVGYRIPALGSIRFEFFYALILTIIAFLFTPKINSDSSVIPYVILYFIILVIQIPFSGDLDASMEIFENRIIKFSFMAFFIISFVRSPSHLKYFLGSFLLACLKMGQEGFIGKITGSMLWENQGIMRLNGVTPLYSHPNSYSGMALGTLPFIYSIWQYTNKFYKLILIVLAVFSLNIILYTGSRTGYIGFLVFLIIIYYKQIFKKINIIWSFTLGTFLIAALLIFVPQDYVERFDSIYTLKEKEGHSEVKRIQIIEDALEIFIDNPLGIGIAAFPKVRTQRFGRFQDTHNLYLEIATNLGIQGIIVFTMLIYKIYQALFGVIRIAKLQIRDLELLQESGKCPDFISSHMHPHTADLSFVASIAFGLIVFLTIRLTLGLFGHDLYEIYWWFCIGLTIALQNIVKSSDRIVNHYKIMAQSN